MRPVISTERRIDLAGKRQITAKSIFYTAVSCVWIFGGIALGHIIMVLIEKHVPEFKWSFGWSCAIMGFVVIYLTRFCKNDGWQSFWGTLGGLGLWFAFEYSLMYGGHRMGVTYAWNGSYPEYRMMRWTFFALLMVVMYLLFQESVRCNLMIFLRRTLRLMRGAVATGKVDNYGPRTAFEYIMCTWFFYVLLLIGYDEQLFGAQSLFIYITFFASFAVFFYLIYKLLGYDRFGANLRYAIPTIMVGWNTIEILAKWDMLTEPWVHVNWPIMTVITAGFIVSTWLIVKDLRSREEAITDIAFKDIRS
jgi:hypothetical protein